MVERSQTEVWRLTPWLVIFLLLGNFILMVFNARVEGGERVIKVWALTVADFVQSPVTSISSAVTNYFTSFAELRSAQDENTQLKERVQELEVELKGRSDLESENERLRQLLDLKEKSKYRVLSARIIGRDPSAWFNSAVINRGSLDGVALNMPVVTDGGLVGRVTAVGPLTAQVDLITHDKSGLGAVIGEIGNSNALGVVSGTGKTDVIEMRYVSGSIEVQPGQVVFTTGQDGIYPDGLKVGEIVEVISGSATVPHRIFIRPAAGLGSMQEVGILLYDQPQKPDFERSLAPGERTPRRQGQQ
ncbi:MAG TPA: rod shape-determining protein MreC [Pyrinomonadaceae bacterium]|nr:rod shape-determining protein MreC [Pyrinomonadaceae bacterium]